LFSFSIICAPLPSSGDILSPLPTVYYVKSDPHQYPPKYPLTCTGNCFVFTFLAMLFATLTFPQVIHILQVKDAPA
jgi:hypothetical protein